MADLVTHLCTVLLPLSFARTRVAPWIAVGVVLPDALGRAIPLALDQLMQWGVAVPPRLLWPWSALHEPIGYACASVALGSLFVRRDRRTVTMALLAGGVAHTLLDILQDHHGEGYLLFAPFSAVDIELGWIGSEATVGIALPLALVTAVAWVPAAIEAFWGATPRLAAWLLILPIVPCALMRLAWGGVAGAWCAAAALVGVAAVQHWFVGRVWAYAAAAAILALGLLAMAVL